jgi:hypothetical protein
VTERSFEEQLLALVVGHKPELEVAKRTPINVKSLTHRRL